MGTVYNRGTKGDPVWWVGYKEGGRWVYKRSGMPTKAQARRFVEEIEARIAAGRVGLEPIAEPGRVPTFKELADLFVVEYSTPRVKDIETYRRDAKYMLERHIVPALGAKPADRVRPADVVALRDHGLRAGRHARKKTDGPEGLRPQTVKHWLMCISRIYNWARQRELIECPNPVAFVDKPSLAGRDQDFDFLSKDEVERLLGCEQIPTSERMVYAVAVYAGLRMGELYGLRWRDLDLDRGQLTVKRSYPLVPKSNKLRHVPINPRLATLLRQWREICPPTEEGLVLPTPPGKRKRKDGSPATYTPHMRVKDSDYDFAAHRALAGCHKVRFHDLRHTFASHFMMSGGNILTLQKLLGHSSVSVTQRYAHLAPDFMRGEVERMSFEPKASDVVRLDDYRAERVAAAAGGPALTTPVLRGSEGSGLASQKAEESRVGAEGIEPSTSGLRVRCSAN